VEVVKAMSTAANDDDQHDNCCLCMVSPRKLKLERTGAKAAPSND